MAKKYIAKNIESTFDRVLPYEDSDQERMERLRGRNVGHYRLKSTFCGEDILESEIYPVWNTRKQISKANEEKRKRTPSEQRDINYRKARKQLMRIINTNFTRQDVWASFTYDDDHLPISEEAAYRNMTNFIRRLIYYCKKHNIAKPKYVYVTEYVSAAGETVRVHHHLVINFSDRDLLESMWRGGGRKQTRRLQPDDAGLTGMAWYLSKPSNNKKSYGCSLGLLPYSDMRIADSKVSRKKAWDMRSDYIKAEQFYQKTYPNYVLNSLEFFESDYCDGVYIYAQLKRRRN